MSTEIQSNPTERTAKEKELIRNTYASGLSMPQFELFLTVADRMGLDPIEGEIFPLPFREKKDSTDPPKLVIHVSIKGYRSRSAKCEGYIGPANERFFLELKDGSHKTVPLEEYAPSMGKIISATIDIEYETKTYKGTAMWESYFNQNNPLWNKFGPHLLLKCAEAIGHRKSQNKLFGGTYAPEEFHQAIENTKTLPPAAPQNSSKKNNPKKEHESALDLWETISEFLRAKDMTGDHTLLIETALELTISRMEVTDLADLPTERIPELAEFARTTLLHLLRDKGMIK